MNDNYKQFVTDNLEAINGALARSFPAELLFEYVQDDNKRAHAYYSPRRPIGFRDIGGHRTGGYVVSFQWPQPVEDMLKHDLYPLNNAARIEWIKAVADAWDDSYVMLTLKDDYMHGALVSWDNLGNGWKVLYYNETGWTGDSTRKTLDDAILAAIETGAVIVKNPVMMESIVEYWRDC